MPALAVADIFGEGMHILGAIVKWSSISGCTRCEAEAMRWLDYDKHSISTQSVSIVEVTLAGETADLKLLLLDTCDVGILEFAQNPMMHVDTT